MLGRASDVERMDVDLLLVNATSEIVDVEPVLLNVAVFVEEIVVDRTTEVNCRISEELGSVVAVEVGSGPKNELVMKVALIISSGPGIGKASPGRLPGSRVRPGMNKRY